MPGSLGIESFLQAMQLFAIDQELGKEKFQDPTFSIATDIRTQWNYRGQLIQNDPVMNIEVHIKEIRESSNEIIILADADLYNDRLRIYNATDLAVSIKDFKDRHYEI